MIPVKQASASLMYCFMKEKIGQIAKMRTNAPLSERTIRTTYVVLVLYDNGSIFLLLGAAMSGSVIELIFS